MIKPWKLLFILIFLIFLGLTIYKIKDNQLNSINFIKPNYPKLITSNVIPQDFVTPTVTPIATSKVKPKVYIPQNSGYQLRVPILLYHYIGNNPNPNDKQRDYLSVSPEKFEEQMKYLSENEYQTISLDTLYAALKKQATLPSKPVILTFDDGYTDFFYNAYPILKRFNLSATVFIPTGLMDQGYYLSWSQIKEMSSSGLVIFGAHTVHHYNLPSLSSGVLISELKESKQILQVQLGVPINFMAYPNGATNGFVISAVQSQGYIGAVGTWPSKLQSEGSIYNLPRLKVSGSIDLKNFAGLL